MRVAQTTLILMYLGDNDLFTQHRFSKRKKVAAYIHGLKKSLYIVTKTYIKLIKSFAKRKTFGLERNLTYINTHTSMHTQSKIYTHA